MKSRFLVLLSEILLGMTNIALVSSASKNPSAKHDWPR